MAQVVPKGASQVCSLAVRAWRSGKHVWSILARATRDNDYWVTKQVNLQSDTGGHWHIIKSALTSGVGKTTFTVTLPKHAGRHYRVTVSGGGASLKTSRVMSLRY